MNNNILALIIDTLGESRATYVDTVNSVGLILNKYGRHAFGDLSITEVMNIDSSQVTDDERDCVDLLLTADEALVEKVLKLLPESSNKEFTVTPDRYDDSYGYIVVGNPGARKVNYLNSRGELVEGEMIMDASYIRSWVVWGTISYTIDRKNAPRHVTDFTSALRYMCASNFQLFLP